MTTISSGALLLAALLVVCPASAEETGESPAGPHPAAHPSQDEETEGIDHTIIVGIGGAAELELGDGSVLPGGNLMVEWDAIEDWLELEIGASILSVDGGAEVPIDLLIKKPFRLTRWAEFMIGIGPEVVRMTGGAERGNYFGGEAALDCMFWPSGRRVGLWVEPEYDLVFHQRASSGIGTSGGVLFGW